MIYLFLPQVKEDEEKQFFEKENTKNQIALQEMRSFIHINIRMMTIKELTEYIRNKNGLMTLELLIELKNNQFLHWLIMSDEDIMFDNFLVGDKKYWFVNIDKMDIVELRAVLARLHNLPKTFSFGGYFLVFLFVFSIYLVVFGVIIATVIIIIFVVDFDDVIFTITASTMIVDITKKFISKFI